MPDSKIIVINTGPILAIIAAQGDLNILHELYHQVYVPYEVKKELTGYGQNRFGVKEFKEAQYLHVHSRPLSMPPILQNTLDSGEASVIQLALMKKIDTVCIDETIGRRIARLYNLKVTGSLGILLRAKKEGFPISIKQAIENMHKKDIYLSSSLINSVLKLAGEK
jgi:predicted nucleic acid-binding protein